jgi:ribonuclease T2
LNQISKSLPQLINDWPSLKSTIPADNRLFWRAEWLKHGTCSFPLFDPNEYFSVTLKLFTDSKMKFIFADRKFYGKSAPRDEIINAVVERTQFEPQLQCVMIKDKYYLLEIRLCLTANKSPQFQECQTTFNSCVNKDVYF